MKIRLVFFVLLLLPASVFAQIASTALSLEASRKLHQNILKSIKSDLKENYYDANMHGVDVEASTTKASSLIAAATSVEEMSDIVARFLYQFDDSHLFFMPPNRTVKVEYGWDMTFIGDKVFVTQIDEDSDAKKKGVRIGDQIYMIEGYIPTRAEFSFLRYHFNTLRPQSSLNVILIKPGGNTYKVELKAKVTEDNIFMPSTRDLILKSQTEYDENTKQFFHDKIPGVNIWKMPNFQLTPTKVDKMMDKVGKDESLILDLRGNPGGYLASLSELLGNFFDHDLKPCVVKERKTTKSFFVSPRSKETHHGKLIVLIDSDSASAAEIFARTIQIEKRGTVLGDQSAGAVMLSQLFYHSVGLDSKVPYGASITIADLIMSDGQRLEKIGVTPDEKLLPTAFDLANQRDPVMARALQILGIEQTPEQAGAIFFPRKSK